MHNPFTNTSEEKKIDNLRRWNLAMFGLHFIQGTIMLLASGSFALPVSTAYVEFSPMVGKLMTVIEQIGEWRVGPLVAAFLFLSAAAHAFVSFGAGWRWYVGMIKRGLNLARWIEYSLSSSLMIVVIALLVGVYDLSTLILLFSLNAMMILFGWVMEVQNQTTSKTDWTSYFFGCIAGAIPWIVVGLYLFNAGEGDYRAPTFVYWIYGSIFLFFNSFAVNMILQYRQVGRWRDYLYGEKVYLVLSLVAKSLLAWQVWAGTLRPV